MVTRRNKNSIIGGKDVVEPVHNLVGVKEINKAKFLKELAEGKVRYSACRLYDPIDLPIFVANRNSHIAARCISRVTHVVRNIGVKVRNSYVRAKLCFHVLRGASRDGILLTALRPSKYRYAKKYYLKHMSEQV